MEGELTGVSGDGDGAAPQFGFAAWQLIQRREALLKRF